ncbi:MAG: hypothetical protein HHJ11_09660 [Phycicoccus sp.]|nr:hypothetical protein [Phycicoccus sp.]
MTAVPSASQPYDLQLGINVTPTVVSLSDGAELTISADVPLTATGRREAALSGLLYCFAGRVDRPDGFVGGYLGQSGDLDGPRAAASLTRWVITQRRIIPAGMAILRRDQPYRDDYRVFVEARAIMAVSASPVWLLNTHTAAGKASIRLSRAEVFDGEALATEIADTIRTHLFGGLVNPHLSPASNTREAAVRAVLWATRALDTFEVMRALRAGGLSSKGVSWDFSIRRDLALRELETRGTPRVFSCAHRNRRVFWSPTLTKAQALRGYDLAHP